MFEKGFNKENQTPPGLRDRKGVRVKFKLLHRFPLVCVSSLGRRSAFHLYRTHSCFWWWSACLTGFHILIVCCWPCSGPHLAKMARVNPLGDNKGHVGYQVDILGVAAHGWILIKRVAYATADKQTMGFYLQWREVYREWRATRYHPRTNRFIWLCFIWWQLD